MIEYDYDANEITLSPADFVRLYAAPEKEQPKRAERLTRALMRRPFYRPHRAERTMP